MHPPYRGIILVHPHGTYIVKGLKKIIIKSKKYIECVGKTLLLIENKLALGFIVIDYVAPLTIAQFEKKFRSHRITPNEREKWWPNHEILYEYKITHKHIFHNAIPIKYPQGPQTFIKPNLITEAQHIYIGTSGYDYGWFKGGLSEYAQKYKSLELNASYYRIPTPNQSAALSDRTPKDFIFSIKANRQITHFYKLDNTHITNFITAFKPLLNKINCLLFQFPKTFKYNPINFQNLESIKRYGLKFAFEFRHPSWYTENTYHLFNKKPEWTIVLTYDHIQGFNFDLKTWIPPNFL